MRLVLSDLKKITFLRKIYKLANNNRLIVYLVGGCLRDCLLKRNREYLDFDFALKRNSLMFASKLSRSLKTPFVLLDEPHGVARLIYKHTKICANLDFSDFRAPTIEKDLLMRDFTINALAIKLSDIFTKKTNLKSSIIAPSGASEDLEKRKIRVIGKNNFREDPLRMLRSFSIAARLGFAIEKRTREAIKKQGRLIKNVSGERLREELFKIFSIKNSCNTIELLDKSGLLERIIPEIRAMHNLKQGPYHHLDVWKHSLETLRQLEIIINNSGFFSSSKLRYYLSQNISGFHTRLVILKFASILHDIGKPAAFRASGDEIHFYGHERIGKNMVEDIAVRLKFSTKETTELKTLIYWHLRPGYMADIQDLSRRALFRYFRDTNTQAVGVALLSLADQRATRGRFKKSADRSKHEKLIRSLIRQYFKKAKDEKKPPLINGYDIMQLLNLEPGPVIGRILNEINEACAEKAVNNKREALEWAKRFYKKIKL